jgi:hypothetical protein
MKLLGNTLYYLIQSIFSIVILWQLVGVLPLLSPMSPLNAPAIQVFLAIKGGLVLILILMMWCTARLRRYLRKPKPVSESVKPLRAAIVSNAGNEATSRHTLKLDARLPPMPDGVSLVLVPLHSNNRGAVDGIVDLVTNHATKLGLLSNLRQSGTKPFVIGYLGGIIDALCQHSAITDEQTRIAMLHRLYTSIFDEKDQTAALENFLKYQAHPSVHRGIKSGGSDMLSFLDGEGQTFVGLFKHLRDLTI